jgi:hypothetical protein
MPVLRLGEKAGGCRVPTMLPAADDFRISILDFPVFQGGQKFACTTITESRHSAGMP